MKTPTAVLTPPGGADHHLEVAPRKTAYAAGDARRRTVGAFVELTKPRVVAMILVTTLVGFYLGSSTRPDWFLLAATLVGTALAAGGTLALNQYLERDADLLMRRTQGRPLPSGRLLPLDALLFGATLTAVGLLVLTVLVNPLSGLVTATTVVTYLGCYTPMKRHTPLCSVVGAVPGALPPVTGWAAAGSLSAGAWSLFGILFLWQLPHSLAIARLYADDYARAGFRLLPIVDRDGHGTERQILVNCVALLAVSLTPTLLGVAGGLYFAVALAAGVGFLAFAAALAVRPSIEGARRVMLASLIYLPLLLVCMAWDKVAP